MVANTSRSKPASMDREPSEGRAQLNGMDRPPSRAGRGLELLANQRHIGPAALTEEVEVLRRPSREARRKQRSAASEEKAFCGRLREEQTSHLDLKFRQTAHDEAASITGCHAALSSRGRTRSSHRSTRSAPSMKRRRSTAVPSRSTTS